MSSSRPYNYTPSENWRHGQWHEFASHGPDHSNSNRWQPFVPHSPPPPETPQNSRRVLHDPWLPVTERSFAVPSGATRSRFPYSSPPQRRPPLPPVRVLFLEDGIPRNASYRRPTQRPFHSPPPWFVQNREMSSDESKLSPDDQKAALNKLKKEIYNPVQTKVARQVSLYFRGSNNANNETKQDMDEDGKRCAVCLEDFVPKEMVTVTPCHHMFHEDCIVPWVTSHGSCPVCRFAICEKENTRSAASTTANSIPDDLMLERDLISIMRAFDGALELDNIRSLLLPRLSNG